MERLTGKGAKSLKEAYAKVYIEEQIKVPDYTSMSDEEFSKLVQKSGNPEGVIAKRLQQRKAAANTVPVGSVGISPKGSDRRNEVEAQIKRDNAARTDDQRVQSKPSPSTPKSTQTYTIGGKTYSSKAEINKEYDRLRKSGGDAKAFGDKAFKATNKPAIGTTPGGTKFERRAPTSAELRAAQAARAAGKGAEGQIKAAVQQGQRQASVNASIKSANRPSVLNKQAPTGSALRAQQDRLAQKNKIQKEVAAVRSGIPAKIPANTQSSVNNTVKSGTVSTGDTVKTKVNPDTSISVTQTRTPAATKKITQSLKLSSVDLFDIVKGEFIEEGYSEEDTMYMMANLNEEQLQEFLKQLAGVAIRNAKKIPAVKGLVTKVGGMFNKAPTQMPSGQIGALRLRQGQATDAVNRLNQSTAASKAKDATRAATREKTRLNNLDPRAVSDRNAREASTQVRQRNMEMGRPSWYNPNNPGSKEALKRYYADKRAGVKGLPE
jgi:hypothetical protein